MSDSSSSSGWRLCGGTPEKTDFAVAHSSFTVRNVEASLSVSYGRANKLIGQLMDLGFSTSWTPTPTSAGSSYPGSWMY